MTTTNAEHVSHSKLHSHAAKNPFIQPKLTVNQPGDQYEQEADRVADTVMRMPVSGNDFFSAQTITPLVQRQCSTCSGEEETVQKKEAAPVSAPPVQAAPTFISPAPLIISRKCSSCNDENIQRKEEEVPEDEIIQTKLFDSPVMRSGDGVGGSGAPASVESALNSSGQPMDTETRGFMEDRFGYDFGHVQIHTGAMASSSAADIQAKAYTHGHHIVFGSGHYQPGTESGRHLLAHELTHVVQQSHSLSRKPMVQRASVYWMPAGTGGGDVHKEVQEQMGLVNSGLYSEVPMPNATAGGIDPGGGIGKVGYADLLTSTGGSGKFIGVYATGHNSFANFADITRLQHQLMKDGKDVPKAKFNSHAAPLAHDGGSQIKNMSTAPTDIKIGDLKPLEEGIITAGFGQLSNYKTGMSNVATYVNDLRKEFPGRVDGSSNWSLSVGDLTGLTIPDRYKFPTATGQSSVTLQITFGMAGALLKYLEESGSLVRIKAYQAIKSANRLPGKLYLAESKQGVYTYAYIPDAFSSATNMGALPGATGIVATGPLGKVHNMVENDIKGKLRGTPFALKKHDESAPQPARPPLVQQKTNRPLVSRAGDKPPEKKDKFDFTGWKTSLDKYQGEFDKALEGKELKDMITFANQAESYEHIRKEMHMPATQMPELDPKLKNPVKQLHGLEVWTYPGVSMVGRFRQLFGKAFVGMINTYEDVKAWIKKKAKSAGGGKVGTIAAAALNVTVKVLTKVGSYIVSEVLNLLAASLQEGIKKNLEVFYDELVPDAIKDKIEEAKKLEAKYSELADKTIEQWKESLFGDWLKYFDTVEAIREKLSFLGTIEKIVRWGAAIIACASPPAVGCLWNVFKEIGMTFIALVIQTCWFSKHIMGFLLDNFSFIKELPASIAKSVKDFVNGMIPLPAGMLPLLGEINTSSIDPKSYNMDCDEASDGANGVGPERRELWLLINEIGEEKFMALLEVMKKHGAGDWVLLTADRLRPMKEDLKSISAETLKSIAASDSIPEGTPVAVESFLKDIAKYSAKEKGLIEAEKERRRAAAAAKAGTGGTGEGGTGKTPVPGGGGGSGTGTPAASPVYAGKVSGGKLDSPGKPVRAQYTAVIYGSAPPSSATMPTDARNVDLRIYVYRADDSLEKQITAKGVSLKIYNLSADSITLQFPADTIVEYGTGRMFFTAEMKITISKEQFYFSP